MTHRFCFLPAAFLLGAALHGAGAVDDPNRLEKGPADGGRKAADEPKTHTLFMGADVAVQVGKGLYPVWGVQGSSWVVEINGAEKVISSRQGPLTIKMTPKLKLTERSATVDGFKKVRAYSFNNDPTVRATRALNYAASTSAMLQDNASNAQHIADAASNKALGAAAGLAAGNIQLGANASNAGGLPSNNGISQAQNIANAVQSQAQNGNEVGGMLAPTGLDAMEVEFEISSARPLASPYIVTMTQFHPKGGEQRAVQNLVYARELGPIDARAAKVHFIEGGFPFDFEVVDFQMHLYDRGEEVATTVSSKRVQLTRDEAFEYVKIEYVAAHQGATLPPEPALALFPSDLPARIAAGAFKDTFYVRVSKEGRADGAFSDPSCSKRIEDAYRERVVSAIRFYPALTAGEAVAGIASLSLTQLKILEAGASATGRG
jgi:hypothetical protein